MFQLWWSLLPIGGQIEHCNWFPWFLSALRGGAAAVTMSSREILFQPSTLLGSGGDTPRICLRPVLDQPAIPNDCICRHKLSSHCAVCDQLLRHQSNRYIYELWTRFKIQIQYSFGTNSDSPQTSASTGIFDFKHCLQQRLRSKKVSFWHLWVKIEGEKSALKHS